MFVIALLLATSCEALRQLPTVTNAQVVEAGAFRLPPGGPHASAEFFTDLDRLPQFCRVQATVKPAIEIEVWLPISSWNGKFLAAGNGGYGGSFNYFRLADAQNAKAGDLPPAFAVRCLLSAVRCPLSAVCYLLSAVCYLLSAVCYLVCYLASYACR